MAARRPLVPKQVSSIIPIALKLKELGYSPMPLRSGKDKPFKSWPTIGDTPEEIAGWVGKTVAVRMHLSEDLFCIDLDIQRDDVMTALLAAYEKRWPDFIERCVMRHSGKVTLALFGRLTTGKKHMHSGRWGVTDEHKGGNRVELFTSNDVRYVAVFGVHSPGRDYGYDDGDPLWKVRQADLPEFFDEDLHDLLDIADQVMASFGLEQSETKQHSEGEIAYDLTPDMMAELEDGRRISLEELEEMATSFVYIHGRIFDSGSDSFRVKAKRTSAGLTLWDFRTDTEHRWAHLGAQSETLSPLLKTLLGATVGEATMFGKFVPPGIQLSDLHAFLPKHQYIYAPTGDLWPMITVNSILPPVPLKNADGTPVMKNKKPVVQPPAIWLDRNRAVEQMTWAPGELQVVEGKLATEAGWLMRPGSKTFNLYRPPLPVHGDPRRAEPWIALVRTLYPNDADHIIAYMAHRVQRAAEKINHGILLAGQPGIGKDTLLEPLRLGVGSWNFKEASPAEIMGAHNDFLKAVVLRISEARDLGEVNRYALFERMKTILAAPPDFSRVNIKYVPQFYVVNVMGVFITTNHSFDGIYLPPDDRRHYVAATEIAPEQVTDGDPEFWQKLWGWYRGGGLEHAVAFLADYDLAAAGFDAKAPPLKTEAFKRIVGAGAAPEVAEMMDIIEKLAVDAAGQPCAPVVTTADAVKARAMGAGGNHDLYRWLDDRKNRRAIPHRFDACGYTQVINPHVKDGMWVVKGRRQTIYGQTAVTQNERMEAANRLLDTVVVPFKSVK